MQIVSGHILHNLAKKLWPFNRSITGNGVRQTLAIIKKHLPDLECIEIPSNTKVFDWTIPQEWIVREAYIISPSGKKICDFHKNNLHLIGYSESKKIKLKLSDLQNYLHSLPEQPSAIPYITSYYEKRWGFCISQEQRDILEDGIYEVFIDTDFYDGYLTYGEVFIRGSSDKEILLSTYICHPSMANNELSGISVTTFIVKWLKGLKNRRYSYRIVFLPETIGSIAFIHKNIDHLKAKIIAGYVVTCVGDDRNYSFLPTRIGNTISDTIGMHVVKNLCSNYKIFKWNDRGSDERQYCSPGVDLPIASLMRTKYAEYPEYHTSLDDLLSVVTPKGLMGGYKMIKLAIEAIEKNCYPITKIKCEPFLSKHGLYPTLSTKFTKKNIALISNLITWSDGTKSLIEIADNCGVPVWILYSLLNKLKKLNILNIHYK